MKTNLNATQTGFTLIDLAFTLSIVAIILKFGMPEFEQFIEKSKVKAQVMQLRSNLQLARTTAITEQKKSPYAQPLII